MKGEYMMQHEEAELAQEITLNYERYSAEDQHRDVRGRLTDPLAKTFGQRMNDALGRYSDLVRFSGQAVLLGRPEGD